MSTCQPSFLETFRTLLFLLPIEMTSKLAVEKLAHYVEELLQTKGLDYAKKVFTSIAVEANQDRDEELSSAALLILATLKEIDEQKN